MNQICLIIPTCNRAECIRYYLEKKAGCFLKNGIDMIIYDSSIDDSTETVTFGFIHQGLSNVKYVRYCGKMEKEAIDRKVFSAAKAYCRQYDYLCFSGDGAIVHLDRICSELHLSITSYDLAVYDNSTHMGFRRKEYVELPELFRECCWRMTLLSSVILSGPLLERCVDSLAEYHALWLPMSIFYTPLETNRRIAYLANDNFWEVSPYIHQSSWKSSGNALKQWGQIWCDSVDALPSHYDRYKDEVLLSHDRYTHLFSVKSLIALKASNNITWRKVQAFRPYMSRVTKTSPFWFYAIALGINRRFAHICIHFYHSFWRRTL